MRIAVEVKGYITAPAPEDIVYAPIDLAVKISDGLVERGHTVDFYAPEGSRLDRANVVTRGLEPLVRNYSEYHDALVNPAFQSDNVLATWDQFFAGEMFRRAALGVYDLLHFHHPEVALPFVSIYPDVPVVYTMHDPIEPLQRRVLQLHKTANQHFVSISDKQRKTAPELNYAATVYNGIDLELFSPVSTEQSNGLLFVGSILPHKGAKHAVEVARQTESELTIIGPTYPDHMDYFCEYVEPYLNDKIRYLGHISHDEMPHYFQRAKALLMPIQWEEPFGLTMVEAMACGTPVVALCRGSTPEVVANGESGFVVDSVSEMIEAVRRLGAIDRAKCRAHVVDRFSISTMVADYEKVFTGIVSRRRGL